MTRNVNSGWYPDPSGRHQYRWWDGTAWTHKVSDDGVGGSDPLMVAQTPPGAATSTGMNFADNWNRIGGRFIDELIFFVMFFILSLIMFSDYEFDTVGVVILGSIIGVGQIVYETEMIHRKGQTIGKIATKVLIVDIETQKLPTRSQAFKRTLIRFPGLIPGSIILTILSTVLLLVGYMWALWEEKKQGWHDKLANTTAVSAVPLDE